MRNPLRSEAESFRFLIAVIVGALVIVGAAYLNTWLGVAAAVLAVAGIVGTVVGAYYYIKIVKVMYFDDPAPAYARVRQPVQGLLILVAAVIVSPLGYLLVGPLGQLTTRAAGALF